MRASVATSDRDSQVARAFDHLAPGYDASWTCGVVGRLQRLQVRRTLGALFGRGDRILELGCGTGADATWLAAAGVRVHATDISPRMLSIALERVKREGLSHRVTFELRAIEELADIRDKGPFDGAISNFGAINCVKDLHPAASNLGRLVRPGGKVALCFMGRFCLWETVWHLARMNPGKAFRRLKAGVRGIESSLEPGSRLRVFYPSVPELVSAFDGHFRVVSDRGIAVLVPPSYLERHARVWRHCVAGLTRLDDRIGSWPVFRGSGDHRMLVFERTGCQ